MSHARNRVRAATIKKFDIKENIQFEHIDLPVIENDKESMEAMTAAELTEKPGLLN